MLPISIQESGHEVHRDRPFRRLRRSDVVDDGRGLDSRHRTSPDCGPVRLVGIRLASGPVRVCLLHDRALVDGSCLREVNAMLDTETRSKPETAPADRDAIPFPAPPPREIASLPGPVAGKT